MQLSPHFHRIEFKCKCNQCDFDTIDSRLLVILEAVRSEFGPVKINSAARCLKHNRAIGSTDSSFHVKARACDIVVEGASPKTVYDFLDEMYGDEIGLGLYVEQGFVHVDTRGYRARW